MSGDENEVEKLPSREVLKSLVLLAEQTKKKTSAATGELGARVKAQVEEGDLNAHAFRILAALHRMDELKRNATIDHLLAYIEIAQETIWDDGHVGDLDKLARQEADDEEDAQAAADAAHVAKNVKALEKGISELPPEEAAASKKRSPKVVGFPGAEGKALN